jgi:hypothetical protein
LPLISKSWGAASERPLAAPPLGPLLAGARARGVADGLAWLGLAAVLIDDRGEALHVSPEAQALMGDALYIRDGRLRARDPAADQALIAAVRDALTLAEPRNVQVKTAWGEIWAYVAPMPADEDDPFQLLRAVALLSRAGDWGPAQRA